MMAVPHPRGAPQWAKEVLPTTTALEGNPIEAGGVIPFGDLVEIEMDPLQRSYTIEEILEATKHRKRWRYLVKWKGYDECSWINEDQITGTDEELNSSINVAQLRYAKHMEEISNRARATRKLRRIPNTDDSYDITKTLPYFERPSKRRDPVRRTIHQLRVQRDKDARTLAQRNGIPLRAVKRDL